LHLEVGEHLGAVDFRAVVQNPEVEEGHQLELDRLEVVEAVWDPTVRQELVL
jgi:hypothetical protein